MLSAANSRSTGRKCPLHDILYIAGYKFRNRPTEKLKSRSHLRYFFIFPLLAHHLLYIGADKKNVNNKDINMNYKLIASWLALDFIFKIPIGLILLVSGRDVSTFLAIYSGGLVVIITLIAVVAGIRAFFKWMGRQKNREQTPTPETN